MTFATCPAADDISTNGAALRCGSRRYHRRSICRASGEHRAASAVDAADILAFRREITGAQYLKARRMAAPASSFCAPWPAPFSVKSCRYIFRLASRRRQICSESTQAPMISTWSWLSEAFTSSWKACAEAASANRARKMPGAVNRHIENRRRCAALGRRNQ